jgi:iron complex outermembrane recepter protein
MRRDFVMARIIAVVCAAYMSQASSQQRAQDNAVTSAEDAFGTSIGLQSVGLYSQNDARGFDPQQAGNLRIEGLYFDQQTYATSPCVVRETAMRIGIAAQAYSFPSPTGIADFSLRTPGDSQAFSGLASRGPFSGLVVQVEEQIPVQAKTLSADFCVAHYQGFLVDLMRHDDTAVFGSTLNWRLNAKTEIIPFWSYVVGGGRQELPGVYTDGTVPLPQFRERDLASQTWTNQGWRMTTIGAVVKSELDSHWQVTGGLFHSRENDPWSFAPYLQLNADGTADSNVDVSPPQLANSTSGELRLTGVSVHDAWRQQLQFAIRGRDVARSYGGDDDIDFGNIALQDRRSLHSRRSCSRRAAKTACGSWTSA